MSKSIWSKIRTAESAIPIYRRVAEHIRERIVSGELPEGEKLPSEAELAAKFEVNLRTLRNGLKILSEQGFISQCQGRGTFVSYRKMARRLRFGILFGDAVNLNDLYPMRMLAALENAVSEDLPAELVLIHANPVSAAALMKIISHMQCDGLLVFTCNRERLLCRPQFDRIPMVFINIERQIVIPDNRFHVRLADGAITKAVDYLYRLGHRRIGYISSDVPNLKRRNKEFLAAVNQSGLRMDFIRIADDSVEPYRNAEETVGRLWDCSERPSALVFPSVLYAYGAWQGLMLRGVKIPEECSLIGFDVNTSTNPHFTTIVQPIEKMARKALELLVAQQECGKALKQKHYDFDAEICEQDSCIPFRQINKNG